MTRPRSHSEVRQRQAESPGLPAVRTVSPHSSSGLPELARISYIIAPNPHCAGEEAEAQRGQGSQGGTGTPGRRPQVLPSRGTEGGGPGLAFGFQRDQANVGRCQPRRTASVKRGPRRPWKGDVRLLRDLVSVPVTSHALFLTTAVMCLLRPSEPAPAPTPGPCDSDSSPFARQKLEDGRTSSEAESQATIHTSSPCPRVTGGR